MNKETTLTAHRWPQSATLIARRIAFFYFIVATFWLIGGNRLLALLSITGADHEEFEIVTEVIFIVGSTAVLFAFSRHLLDRWINARRQVEFVENRWRALIENSADAILICDEKLSVVYASPSLARILGYDADEVYSMHVQQAIHPDDMPIFMQHLWEVVAVPNMPVVGQSRYRHKNGEWRILEEVTSNHLYDPLIKGLVINTRDITERTVAEEQMRQSDQTARALLNAPTDSAFLLDAMGTMLDLNDAATIEFGKSREELIGAHVFDLFPPHIAEVRRARFDTVIRTGVTFPVEYERDGQWYSGALYPICDTPGVTSRVAVLTRNITEQRNSRAALQESEEKYRLLVDNSPEASIVHQDGIVTFANVAAARLVGLPSAADLVGKPIFKFVDPISAPLVLERTQRMLAGETVPPINEVFLHADGRPVDVEVRAARVMLNGKPAIQVQAIDITERLRTQESINASLREKEVLLKEIHHRVKNNLQVISSLLNLQSSSLHDPQLRAMFSAPQNRVRSMALVHELLYKSTDLTHIDFDAYLRTLTDSLSISLIGNMQDIHVALDLQPLQLNIEKAVPFGLIATELFSNSIKHGFKNNQSGRITVKLHADDQGRCVLRITDNGGGLPPGFNIANATTLGLQLIPTLCEQIGADLTYESGNGETYFQVAMQE